MRWMYDLAGACSGFACVALFVAAARERGGRFSEGRRLARRAGFLAGGAGVLQLLVAAWLPWSSRQAWLLAAGVGAAAACSAIVLLAGLSRKPRPSCWFAAGSWLVWLALRVGS